MGCCGMMGTASGKAQGPTAQGSWANPSVAFTPWVLRISWCCLGSDSRAGCPPTHHACFPKHRGTSYLRVHLLTLDLGERHAGEVHAVCEERHHRPPSSSASQLRAPNGFPCDAQALRGSAGSEGQRRQRPPGQSPPKTASVKNRGFGAPAAPCLPFSSTCDFPALVEATTPAVAWLTPRDACWSLQRLTLSLSAFTCRSSEEGCAYTPPGEQKTSPTVWVDHTVPQGHPKTMARGAASLLPAWGQSLLRCWAPTLEAATSWAVLAAISREQTISSSNVPLPWTTRSAASLWEGRKGAGASSHYPTGPPCGDNRTLPSHSSNGGTYTMTVAPQPTALEAEMRPSVQREFLA